MKLGLFLKAVPAIGGVKTVIRGLNEVQFPEEQKFGSTTLAVYCLNLQTHLRVNKKPFFCLIYHKIF